MQLVPLRIMPLAAEVIREPLGLSFEAAQLPLQIHLVEVALQAAVDAMFFLVHVHVI